YCSYDRGRSWGGPFRLRVEGIDRPLRARTDYIVEGAGQAKIFLPTLKSDGASGRSLMAETTDGGQRFHFVGWRAPEPETPKENSKHSFSIMPSTERRISIHFFLPRRSRNAVTKVPSGRFPLPGMIEKE
ncbi:hypothetical protein, partial [Brachyspira hyodysenteriae]|uniref:hypothetical protein n=1 Tax=Brachyspira hyodysenteriae TaxID=159 RepID=UPI0018EF3EFB